MFNKKVKNSGITLIALVITIIVLLILAGVSIATLTGNNGIIQKTADAKAMTEKSQIIEQARLDITAETANKKGYGLTVDEIKAILGTYFTSDSIPEDLTDLTQEMTTKVGGYTVRLTEVINGVTIVEERNNIRTIAEAKSEGTVFTANKTTIKDDYDNEVVIPKGFKVASGTDGSGTKVEEGIVIEDADEDRDTFGSQFVWIPVGTGIKVSEKISASGTIDIPLGRYVFNKSTGEVDLSLSKTAPSDHLVSSSSSENYFTEGLADEITNNKHAKDIAGYISSANSNKGYYIARYEAGINASTDQYAYAGCSRQAADLTYGDSTKIFAKDGSVKPLSIKGKGIWNAVTQSEAATIARSMYDTNSDKVTSDLINSYAWDTAILFIQKCGNNEEDSSKYSIQRGYSSISTEERATAGNNKLAYQPGGTTARTTAILDTQCKICDMAGNVYEWSTESYSDTHNTRVLRGGKYGGTNSTTSGAGSRVLGHKTTVGNDSGFRPILYL